MCSCQNKLATALKERKMFSIFLGGGGLCQLESRQMIHQRFQIRVVKKLLYASLLFVLALEYSKT